MPETQKESRRLPLLIYDGDCSFCRLWIERWKVLTGDRVEYAPYQQASGRFPEIALEHFKKSVQLVLPDGQVLAAAEAVFGTLAFAPRRGAMLWVYERIPGAAAFSEAVYRFVAARRSFLYRLARFLWGPSLAPASHVLTRWVFLRLLGLTYLIAFVSLAVQITGLVGSHGIVPAARFLDAVRANFGPERYWEFPTLAWLGASDSFLRGLTLCGAAFSLLLVAGVATPAVLAALWVLYLSLNVVGQDFLMFQWDGLLLEAGFLAIFLAPFQFLPSLRREREPSHAVLWLLRFLNFRLMVSSGLAKLVSRDPTWRNLTALNYHYETQPLPTPLGWYAHQLPVEFQRFSVAVMFFVEIIVPFLVFAPRRLRFFGAGAMISLQALIALTGNYAFFNLLTIALCLLLFDDAGLRRIVPRRLRQRLASGTAASPPPPSGRRPSLQTSGLLLRRALTAAFTVLVVSAGVVEIPGPRFGEELPRPVARLFSSIRALRVTSSYGLFAVMSTSRFEIVIQGSRDGETWEDYEFKYKPGDVDRRPGWVAPYQPRLDWQMWFAALGTYQDNRWFSNLMLRLLQGSPEVVALLAKNPFPDAPPRYLRALFYDYHFTDFATRRATGAWWRRELKGQYFPTVSLR